MRYIMLTYSGPRHTEWWKRASVDEKRADIDKVTAWFREHGAAGRIVGGEELGWPEQAKTLRKRGMTDGPFIETKEILGGFITLEVPDEETALAVAGGWPGLEWDDDAVELRPWATPSPRRTRTLRRRPQRRRAVARSSAIQLHGSRPWSP
ncbi:MAG: YciI family protein [Chloroflexi bacterium]|nr:YciI family protein [Chloroflexota bacterium]